jgi:probable HAF family extracellular repeat protein
MSLYRIRLPALAAVVLFALALPLTARAQSYQVVDLGLMQPLAINSSGEIAGYYDGYSPGESGTGFAATYSNGITTLVSDLANTACVAINAKGEIVLSTPYGSGIPGLPSASDINDAGEIVGWAFLGNSGPIVARADFANRLTTLPMPPGAADSFATSVNDSGEIVGYADGYSNAEWHAFVYDDGTTADLNDLIPANSGLILEQPVAVNDSGWIIGTAFRVSNGSVGGFLLKGSDLIDFGPGFDANGINSAGEVVGNEGTTALLYDNGWTTNLNTLLPAESGWILQNATAINDNGWIVGNGINPAGQADGFLLIPTPEPASIGLLAVGAVTLLARRRRAVECGGGSSHP